jgi:hypothetical protein
MTTVEAPQSVRGDPRLRAHGASSRSVRAWRRPVLAVLVALWLGASIFFAAVVAPALFAVLPQRALAGAVVGRTLPALFIAGMVLGLAALMLTRGGPHWRVGAATGGIVAAACAAAHFVVGRRLEMLRAAIGPALETLAPADPRRAEFGRLHGASVLLLGVAVVAGAWLVVRLISPRLLPPLATGDDHSA